MAWTPLGTQFCLELAFGVLLGLVLLARAPLGLFFHRLMGLTAALPLVVVATVPPSPTSTNQLPPLACDH